MTREEIWGQYFQSLSDPKLIRAIHDFESLCPDEAGDSVTEGELRDFEKDCATAVESLSSKGVNAFSLYLLKLVSKVGAPRLGSFYDAYPWSLEEKVLFLNQFVQPETPDSYPMLDLSGQAIKEVPPEVVHVSLEKINIASEESPFFYGELALNYNPGLSLSEKCFQRMNHFEGVHFVGLEREELPKEIAALTQPIMLNFSWSNLKKLPRELYQLKQLKGLKFNWTNISEVSDEVLTLKNLCYIEASETPFFEMFYKLENGHNPQTSEEVRFQSLIPSLKSMGCKIEG